jgi:hypothetical protein
VQNARSEIARDETSAKQVWLCNAVRAYRNGQRSSALAALMGNTRIRRFGLV